MPTRRFSSASPSEANPSHPSSDHGSAFDRTAPAFEDRPRPAGPTIELVDVTKTYPPRGGQPAVRALDGVSLTVTGGSFSVVLGPSGSGKSTLLGAVGGLVHCDRGAVTTGGRVVGGPGPDRVMVFQEHALFDWKTVRGNVEFGLRARGLRRRERRLIVDDRLSQVRLAQVADRYPYELSGGMRQRVALARALVLDPPCLLMDEPFGSLDHQLRLDMQDELLALWQGSGATVLFVTHDVEEAIHLADRIVVLGATGGRVVGDITIDVPRPRERALPWSPEVERTRERLWALLAGRPPT